MKRIRRAQTSAVAAAELFRHGMPPARGVFLHCLLYNTTGSSCLTPDGRNTMTSPQPRYSKDEHARRGTALYEQKVRPQVEAGNRGRIVALDVDTGAFEIADDTLTASQRLLARCPNAQIW